MRFREPFNAWSHLVGLVLAAAGTGLLLTRADTPSRWLAFSVYGVHGLICPESAVGSNRAALNTNADKMAQA